MAIDKAVDSTVLDGYFEDIADAIRDKGGSGTYTPAQMPQAIEDIPGEDENFMRLIRMECLPYEDVVCSIKDPGTAIVYLEAGNSLNGIRSISMPNVENFCFPHGTRTYGGFSGGLSGCNLESINVPKCKKLQMTSSNNYHYQNLRSITAPELELFIGQIASTYLTELNFPKLTNFDGQNNTFRNCTNLKTVKMPLAVMSSQYNYHFHTCSSLESLEIFGGSIGSQVFYYDTNFVALIIRGDAVANLSSAYTFYKTPIESGTGYIYVPRDLISAYEAATNWSTYAGQFRAIEDYTDDGTLTGEFIMPT